jgi:hypothetical protein
VPDGRESWQAPQGFGRDAYLSMLRSHISSLRSMSESKALADVAISALEPRVAPMPLLHGFNQHALHLWQAPLFGPVEPVLLHADLIDNNSPATKLTASYARLSDGAFALAIAAETYPGRLLVRQSVLRQASMVRRSYRADILEDGWWLYAISLALDSGLVARDLRAERARWSAVRWAAARALIDAQLHSGTLGFAESVTALSRYAVHLDESAFTHAEVEAEVVDILAHPTQACAALLGYEAITAMRDRAQRLEGAEFSLYRFHDLLLGLGSIPPAFAAHALFQDALPTLEAQTIPTATDLLPHSQENK